MGRSSLSKLSFRLSALAFIAVAASVTPCFGGSSEAQRSHEQIAGTVEKADSSVLTLRTADGRVVTVRLEHHHAHPGMASMKPPPLRPGDKVVVDAERMGADLVAHHVEVERGASGPMHPDHPAAGSQTASPQHAGHQMPGMGAPMPAQHQMGTMTAPMEDSSPKLFQSDMTLMAGMTPQDPMAGMPMKDWTRMDLGIARLALNHQGGPSGRDAVESSNWNMIMAQKDIGRGRLTLMMMNSVEPATLRKGGSPELFQTGETYKGQPLVDRQHPHDLFMNISATYRQPMGEHGAWWIQLAPRGEPALGPAAFMHRASAGENPSSTLGHHWQDSTHITDDVVTVGGGWKRVSLEASAFHGQEPDEGRWDLDPGALDSVSGRARLQLSDDWSAQVSYGFLKHPEALEPGNLRRTTASVHYGAAGNGPFAATGLWGRNREEHLVSDSFLIEAAWQATAVDHVYGRAEAVEKERALLLTKELPADGRQPTGTVTVRALTLGYLRDFELWHPLKTGLGVDATIYGYPSELDRVYGSFPVSFHAFIRLRWGKPHTMGHAGMPGM